MQEQPICFTSLSLVILDEIRLPNKEPLRNVLGGAGTYGQMSILQPSRPILTLTSPLATLGARLFLRGQDSKTLGWVLHIGNDFPDSIAQELRSWNTTLTIRRESDKPSTRGVVEYKDSTFGRELSTTTTPLEYPISQTLVLILFFSAKTFRYTTPHLSIDEPSLQNTPFLSSKSYPYLTSPQDLPPCITTLLSLRKKSGITQRPLIIWEPAPLCSTPENLQPCLATAHSVDVFSPNHLELASLFSVPPIRASQKPIIEDLAKKVLSSGVGPDGNGTVIIRAGEHGSLVTAQGLALTWIPPFYGPGQRADRDEKIVDATGAGNAFLGAYAVGFLKTGDVVRAACYGSVGASFVLEQVGIPERSCDGDGDGELWNGVDVFARLEEHFPRVLPQSTSDSSGT